MKQRKHLAGSADKDLKLVCEGLRRIEKDLAFEAVESYQTRRMEDFADALRALRVLVGAVTSLCSHSFS